MSTFGLQGFASNFCTDAVGDLWQTEVFCKFRTNLTGITVDSHDAADDQVKWCALFFFQIFRCNCKGVAGRIGICTTECTVGEEICFIAAHADAFTERFFCRRRPHGQQGDGGIWILFFQSDCSFNCVQVHWVNNTWYPFTDQGIGYWIDLNFGGIRNLFNAC